MERRIWVINLVLSLLFVGLSWTAFRSWSAQGGLLPPAPPASPMEEAPDIAGVSRRLAQEAVYRLVARRNLFSPERQEYQPPPPVRESADGPAVAPKPDPATSAEPEPVSELSIIAGKKINLHGVVQMGTFKKALIDNPSREGGEKPVVWVREGEELEGLRVSAIESERLLLEYDNQLYQVPLYEDSQNGRGAMRRASRGPKVITADSPPSEPSKPSTPPASQGKDRETNAAESPDNSRPVRRSDNPFIRKDIPLQ